MSVTRTTDRLARILAEHGQMVDALADADHLVELHDRHLAGTLTVLEPLLC